MAVIQMSRTHNLSEEDAHKLAEDVVSDLAKEFAVKYYWDKHIVKFKGAGAKGHMVLNPGLVELKMEVSFMLLPFRQKIENAMTRRLDEFLSS